MQHRFAISADLESVSTLSTQLETLFAPLAMHTRVGLVLAMQELCVNIVKHAYQFAEGDIQVVVDWNTDQIHILVIDHAPIALDMPDEIPEPDPLALPESGLGLFIIFQSFDQVEYDHNQTGNQWRLLKVLINGG